MEIDDYLYSSLKDLIGDALEYVEKEDIRGLKRLAERKEEIPSGTHLTEVRFYCALFSERAKSPVSPLE